VCDNKSEIDVEARNLLASEMMKYIQGEISHNAFIDVADEIDSKCSEKTMRDNLVYKTWYYLVYLVYCCEEYSADGKFEGDERLDDTLIELFKKLETYLNTNILDVPKDLDKKISAVIGLDEYLKEVREERLQKICDIGTSICIIVQVIVWVVFYYVEI